MSTDRGPARRVAIPEIKTLRELRHTFARGGLTVPDKRTPEDHARLAAFRVIEELLRLFEHFRHRVENGERCRIVERERAREPGRLAIELVVEMEP